VEEITYGNTPATALSYTGEIARLAMDCNFNPELVYIQGSRIFGASYRGPYDAGFTYKAWCRANSGSPLWNWTDFWAKYGIGSATAPTLTLPTFSALTGKSVGANNYYNLWNGCKVNKFRIACDKPGTAMEFEFDCLAQMVEWDTDRNFSGLQLVAVYASDPTPPTTNLVTWRGNLTIDLGGGAVTICPSKFSLTVQNNLKREYGTRVGNDAVSYPVALHLQEDKMELVVEMTLPHGTETYNLAKSAGTAITSLTLPVDNKTITLTGGVFAANDFPDYSQAPSEENVKMSFSNIAIA